ncbi:MAG: hypothetical protein M3487_07375 [Actinomycetota bacterium]|nr:hypothetical protein [Actinomycetota bacterium]
MFEAHTQLLSALVADRISQIDADVRSTRQVRRGRQARRARRQRGSP